MLGLDIKLFLQADLGNLESPYSCIHLLYVAHIPLASKVSFLFHFFYGWLGEGLGFQSTGNRDREILILKKKN